MVDTIDKGEEFDVPIQSCLPKKEKGGEEQEIGGPLLWENPLKSFGFHIVFRKFGRKKVERKK